MVARRPGSCFAAALLLVCGTGAATGLTFTVTNTSDAGAGSLRQAIFAANASGGPDAIAFQIPGPGPYVIAPLSALPFINGPTIVGGQTQPGYASGSRIELSGASAGPGVDGLVITGPSCFLVGLVIRNFQPTFLGSGGNGVVLQGGGGSILLGNRIGTDAAGLVAMGNGSNGVLIADSPNNRIGPNLSGDPRNLISGNGTGVRITGASPSNVIVGNFIGTNLAGSAALGNVGDGVVVLGGSGNVIYSTALRQVISGNGGNGVTVAGAATSTSIAQNWIGTDVTGTGDLGNGSDGVEISGATFTSVASGNLISGNGLNGVLLISGASNTLVMGNSIGIDAGGAVALANGSNGVIASAANGNFIGGAGPGQGNVISGNGTNGVRLRTGASGNTVRGNWIGLNGTGTASLPNGEQGVQLNDAAVNNVVGGSMDDDRNWIQGNTLNGIFVTDAATMGNTIGKNWIFQNGANGILVQSGTRQRISSVSLAGNAGLGIDLGGDGVTANDPMDADAGANGLQNYPVITRSGTLILEGTLHSAPNTAYTLEFFASPECDPSGHGEGLTYLGSLPVTTDAGGNASFSTGSLPRRELGQFVTATATDPDWNTSELSRCAAVAADFYTLAGNSVCRLVDTREGGASPLLPGEIRTFGVAGICGVAIAAKAVALNLTVVNPAGPGHLTFYSSGPVPGVSSLNYRGLQTRANNAIVRLDPSGNIRVSCAGGATHVLIDVVGYFE